MEQSYRKHHILKFRKQEIKIMIVTDIIARGIDIPLLDYVINYHIPSNPKTFIHRVGRVARQGRVGFAFNFISSNELPYIADICKFLDHNLPLITDESEQNSFNQTN